MPRSPSNRSPEVAILQALLEQEGRFVSGNELAERLQMSRVAVWQHMEKMKEQGFAFDAARARGYRLAKLPASLHPLLVQARLGLLNTQVDFLCLDTVDSTNDEAARQLASGRAAPFVVLARQQTRGRGRRGRPWHSEPNGNLYSSFAFRPRLSPDRMAVFTLWMGANICELIANFSKLTPGLKWPNDILFDGRKAGGMLTEARIDADEIHDLIFGLGLNVNGPAGAWPGELARRATSLAEQSTAALDLNRFTAALIGRVVLAYEQFVAGDHKATFADLWQKYDVLRGHPVALLHGEQRIAGTAMGIDDAGSLLLRTGHGRLQRFHAGDVTIEKRP